MKIMRSGLKYLNLDYLSNIAITQIESEELLCIDFEFIHPIQDELKIWRAYSEKYTNDNYETLLQKFKEIIRLISTSESKMLECDDVIDTQNRLYNAPSNTSSDEYGYVGG